MIIATGVIGGAPFPVVMGAAETGSNNSANSHPCNLPSGILAGEFLLISCFVSGVAQTPSGWTKIQAGSTRIAAYYKVATGSEGSTVTIANQSGNTNDFVALSFRIRGVKSIAAASASGSLSSFPNPPALNPGWGIKKTLWFAFAEVERSASEDVHIDGYPPGFLDNRHNVRIEEGTDQHIIASASQNNRVATNDPGNFHTNVTASGAEWAAMTVGLRG